MSGWTERDLARAEQLGMDPMIFSRYQMGLRRAYKALGRTSRLRRCPGIIQPYMVPGCDQTTNTWWSDPVTPVMTPAEAEGISGTIRKLTNEGEQSCR